ncbi:GspH/FimT family pseudopilin [Alteromonas sp. 009811495]|uniref:GspH/FimT family pseudopilin n=1 Tax=Alteromonas sp. 009811495 TaxID=3002962 RepID=UPI00237D5BEE|nr:GspH/FimT family pseudopilin [Alteromonas sp. 009811495]WDT84902.1 prepilin-type N-terminal cleavage/methylation domain-containing protein [Alteromonas sp. 009811495]
MVLRDTTSLLFRKLRYKGYTLLEVMLVVTLVSFISALSLPSFVKWKQEIEFRRALGAIAELATMARTAAISRKAPVHLHLQMNKSSCVAVSVDKSCDCQTLHKCAVDDKVWSIQSHALNASIVNKNENKKHVTFSPLGTVFFGGNTTLQIAHASLTGKVTISVLGRVRACSNTPLSGVALC